RLCRLNLRVAPSRRWNGDENQEVDLTIFLDGAAVERTMWNVATPIDPGEHVVSVLRGGSHPFRKTILAKAEASVIVVDVDGDSELGGSSTVKSDLDRDRPAAASPNRSTSPTSESSATTGAVTNANPKTTLPPLRWVGFGVGALAVLGLGAGVFLG